MTAYATFRTEVGIVDAIAPVRVPNRGTVTLRQLEYHRNGVGGVGFWAAIVDYEDLDTFIMREPARMLVVYFSGEDEFGYTAAFDVGALSATNDAGEIIGVLFGRNSWRGADMFEEAMKVFIDEHRYIADVARYGREFADEGKASGQYEHSRARVSHPASTGEESDES